MTKLHKWTLIERDNLFCPLQGACAGVNSETPRIGIPHLFSLTSRTFRTFQKLSKRFTGLFSRTAATFAASTGETYERTLPMAFQTGKFFPVGRLSGGSSRTVRTEVTVERKDTTVLMGVVAAGFDTCPLCGSKVAPDQAEQARLRLPQGPISA